MEEMRQDSARQAALDYHEFPRPGKLEIRATKPLANGRDLSRAYSPGVAEACLEIKAEPATASRYTARGNLVAVVTNGTAVLGDQHFGVGARAEQVLGEPRLVKHDLVRKPFVLGQFAEQLGDHRQVGGDGGANHGRGSGSTRIWPTVTVTARPISATRPARRTTRTTPPRADAW